MNYQDIIHQLHNLSCEKYKSHIIKMGIPESNCLGVPLQTLRQLAKTIGHSNQLGYQLWQSQYHDAKKELEKLVKVQGRSRLISHNSQMGKEKL